MLRIEVCLDDDPQAQAVFAVELEEVDGNLPLLYLLLDAGFEWPSGCRSGTCASCLAEVMEGGELLAPKTRVEEDTLSRIQASDRARLACRIGPVVGAQGVLRLKPVYS